MKFDEYNLSMLILRDDLLCDPLLAAESELEKENYDLVIEKLSGYIGKEKYNTSPVYFMVEYYIGQAIFRKEFAKKLRENNRDRKIKKFRKAILHLENSISLQPDFIDAKLMLGLVCVAMAGLMEREKYHQKAKILYEECAQNGNSIQKEYALERLAFYE